MNSEAHLDLYEGLPTLTVPILPGAVCQEIGGDLWFPEKGGENRTAIKICWNVCTVREACLQFALDNRERWGVWGGTTPGQRRRLLGESVTYEDEEEAA